MQDVHNLINIGLTNLIQILNQHEIFWLLKYPISLLRDFTRFGGKTSYRSVNKGPAYNSVLGDG